MLSICMHVGFIYPLNGNWLSVNGDLLLFAKEIIACSKISDKSYNGKRPFENFKYEVVTSDNILRPKNLVTANKVEANS